MPDYENGKIYKIINSIDNKLYIGSTTLTLRARLQCHRSLAKTRNPRVYAHLNEIGWNNVDIELLEPYPCKSKEELCIREQHYIELLNPELNTRRAVGGPCEHGRQKYQCKECGGSGICEHGRQKNQCKECGGSAICEHGGHKYQCKKCNGDKYHCDVCDQNFCSNYTLKRHITTNSHKKMELAMLMAKISAAFDRMVAVLEDLEF